MAGNNRDLRHAAVIHRACAYIRRNVSKECNYYHERKCFSLCFSLPDYSNSMPTGHIKGIGMNDAKFVVASSEMNRVFISRRRVRSICHNLFSPQHRARCECMVLSAWYWYTFLRAVASATLHRIDDNCGIWQWNNIPFLTGCWCEVYPEDSRIDVLFLSPLNLDPHMTKIKECTMDSFSLPQRYIYPNLNSVISL